MRECISTLPSCPCCVTRDVGFGLSGFLGRLWKALAGSIHLGDNGGGAFSALCCAQWPTHAFPLAAAAAAAIRKNMRTRAAADEGDVSFIMLFSFQEYWTIVVHLYSLYSILVSSTCTQYLFLQYFYSILVLYSILVSSRLTAKSDAEKKF